MNPDSTLAFGAMIEAVMGQALAAAGYVCHNAPVQQASGLFRYERELGASHLSVDFQVLSYADAPARFQVALQRRSDDAGALPAQRITLSALLWETFGVQVLSAATHWWEFADQQAAGEALLEAGKLLFAYGLPWLEGSLNPDALDT